MTAKQGIKFMTRTLASLSGAIALLALAACGGPPVEQDSAERVVARPPAQLCAKAKEAVGTLTKSGALVLDAPAEGTISEQVWLGMGTARQDQFAQLLAFNAACAADQPTAEQQIMLRGDTGVVLTNRIVETSPDTASLLAD